jgi:hypothetical protein
MPGGTLTVDLRDGRAILAGPAEEICRGELVVGVVAHPEG